MAPRAFGFSLFAALVLALSFAVAPVCAEPVERLAIVERAIAFHGGARYTETVTELEVCSKSGCFEVVSEVDGGRFSHTVRGKVGDADDPVERTVRITNDTVERWDDGVAVALDGEQAQRMRDWAMARVYFPFLPFRLDDPGVFKEDKGLETWNGRALHRVEVSFAAGSSTDASDRYLYWLDPETGRVEQFAYSYEVNGGGLRFRKAIDHRRVGGILFFDQENYGVEGPGLTVDMIDPAFAASMRHVSTIRLRGISVRDLER